MKWLFNRKCNQTFTVPKFNPIGIETPGGSVLEYHPQPDITTYELATLFPVFTFTRAMVDRVSYIEENNLQRHFKVVVK